MAGGGAAPPPKHEEMHPHPVKDQLPSVSYCITSPPPWRTSLSSKQCLEYCSFLPCTCIYALAMQISPVNVDVFTVLVWGVKSLVDSDS